MQCPKCSKEIENGAKLCNHCGSNLAEYKKVDEQYKGCCYLLIPFIIMLVGFIIPICGPYITISILIFILVIIVSIKLSKHAKDIVIKLGRKTLDISTALDVILSTIILVVGFFKCVDEYGISSFIWWYVLGAIVVFLATLLANYALYLLVDIRDSLKKLADNIEKKG